MGKSALDLGEKFNHSLDQPAAPGSDKGHAVILSHCTMDVTAVKGAGSSTAQPGTPALELAGRNAALVVRI